MLLKYASPGAARQAARRRASTADSAAISVTKLAKWQRQRRQRHMWLQRPQSRQQQVCFCFFRMQRDKAQMLLLLALFACCRARCRSAANRHLLRLFRERQVFFCLSRCCPLVCDANVDAALTFFVAAVGQTFWHLNKLRRRFFRSFCSLPGFGFVAKFNCPRCQLCARD